MNVKLPTLEEKYLRIILNLNMLFEHLINKLSIRLRLQDYNNNCFDRTMGRIIPLIIKN